MKPALQTAREYENAYSRLIFRTSLYRTCKECYWLGIDRTRWARTVYAAGLGREYTVPCSAVPEDDWRGRIAALCELSFPPHISLYTLLYMLLEAWPALLRIALQLKCLGAMQPVRKLMLVGLAGLCV